MPQHSVPGLVSLHLGEDWQTSELEDPQEVLRLVCPPTHLRVMVLPPVPLSPEQMLQEVAQQSGCVSIEGLQSADDDEPAPRAWATVSFPTEQELIAILACSAGVIVVVLQAPRDIERYRSSFDAVMASLVIDPGFHLGLAMQLTDAFEKQWPECECRMPDPTILEIERPEQPKARLAVSNVSLRIAAEPARKHEIIAEYVASLPDLPEAGEEDPVALSCEAIFPRLMPSERFAGLEEGAIVYREHAGGLWLTLVHHQPPLDKYLGANDLQQLGLDWDAALARALENLEQLLTLFPPQVMGPSADAPSLVLFEGHPHAHAMLLLPGLRRLLVETLGLGCRACLPSLDELIAFPRGHSPDSEHIIQNVENSYEQSPYPVSRAVWQVSTDGFEPESRSPLILL